MKIKPIFTTAVAKDTYNADGSLWMPKGSKVAYCSSFKTKKFGNFSLVAPNPVHLFIANVDYLTGEIKKEADVINRIDKIIVFSKLVNGVNKYTTEELLKLDPNATQIRKLDEDKLYKYLYLAVSCLVSMVAAIEAFVNQELPKDYELTKNDKNGQPKLLKKQEVEAGMRLEEKIELLGKVLDKNAYKQEQFWQDFKQVKKLRDNIVHLKTKGSDLVNRHDALFNELFELDFVKSRDSIVSLLNHFIPGYIED